MHLKASEERLAVEMQADLLDPTKSFHVSRPGARIN